MKKHRVFALLITILVVLPLLFLASCKPEPPHVIPNCQFIAKVTEVGDTRLYVTVIEQGWSSLKNGTPAYVTIPEGGCDAKVGDFVIVEYDSMVQEIYPPIIPNVYKITRCDADGYPLN